MNLFLLIFITTIVSIYFQIRHTLPVQSKGALLMDLKGIIVDKTSKNSKFRQLGREFFSLSNKKLQENSLFDVVSILRQAKNDTNITGLILSLKDFKGADQAALEYIGKALLEFRNSGKPIYAFGNHYSQAQYYLASYANKIYLMPHGMVDLHGIATNNLYYKSFLNKLKINSHVFRVGTYKSAVEPLLRDNMSNETREADSIWVNKMWQNYLNTVAINRKTTPALLFPGAQAILDSLRAVNGNTAQCALNNKWIDEIASRPEIDAEMAKVFGWNKHNKTFNSISIYDYKTLTPMQHKDQIAVIFANGTIVDGSEMPRSVGSDTTADQIRDARINPNIKAIVFRVNSPGGSVTASEIIRSELVAARNAGKPIVISMGGMAASGGYWISTPANYIIASNSTLTGSIGIFGVINTIENSLEAIGIHTDGVSTSSLADVSITKNLPKEFVQMIQLNVENSYRNFIALVAQARNKNIEEIEKIGQGHIWIGSDAIKHGLVDMLGDFDDAVVKAAELAKLNQYQLNWYLNDINFWDLLFTHISSATYFVLSEFIQFWSSKSELVYELDKRKIDNFLALNWNDPKNTYAFCFSCTNILN